MSTECRYVTVKLYFCKVPSYNQNTKSEREIRLISVMSRQFVYKLTFYKHTFGDFNSNGL